MIRRALGAALLSVVLLAPSVAWTQEESVAESSPKGSRLGVGARVRYINVPNWLLSLFLDHATNLSSVGIGAEFVRRKGNFDVVFGFQYDVLSVTEGLYLDKGGSVATCSPAGCPDVDVVSSEGWGLLGVDASFLWHQRLASRLDLRYGAGIGIGVLVGTLKRWSAVCPVGVTVDDLDDPEACGRGVAKEDNDGVPPVVPIVNVLLGLRFEVNPHLTLNLEGGFRDVFFLGLGGEYAF